MGLLLYLSLSFDRSPWRFFPELAVHPLAGLHFFASLRKATLCC
jgi:hypothetical protein